jgi:Kef-type K+ transport system membrane component KefB
MLVFVAFGVAKASAGLNVWMEQTVQIHLNLEPLLVCMSAGFCVRSLGQEAGRQFTDGLQRLALPIFLLFFTMAGASLNLAVLGRCWPLALAVTLMRAAGIFVATCTASRLAGDPPLFGRIAWMAYLTQAGVSIGLAQLAARQLPQIGLYLTTIVLAVITVNQILGPIFFKLALGMAGEAGRR